MIQKEDVMTRKVRKWTKIFTIVSGSLCAIIAPVIIMYIQLAPEIRKAKGETRKTAGEAEAGYETLAEAVKELQGIAKNAGSLIKERDSTIKDLSTRMVRMEVYMEILGRQRGLPSPPVKPAPVENAPDAFADFAREKIEQRVPARAIPRKLEAAKTYQDKRDKMKCSPDDPLCATD